MRQAVRDAWVKFNAPNEGVVDFPYTDSKGLVTTGMGDLCDSPAAMWGCGTWKHGKGGPPASQEEVAAAYYALKQAWPHVESVACAKLTDLRLDDADVTALWTRALNSTWADLLKDFPLAEQWPADAQMALASMGWAMGGRFESVDGFTALAASLNASPPRFADAAPPLALGHFRGPGTQQRQAWDDVCWKNAQAVLDQGGDPDVLHWPANFDGSEPTGPGPLFMAVAWLLIGAAGYAAWHLWKGA